MLHYETDCTLTISESTSRVTASQGCHHVVELLPDVFGQETANCQAAWKDLSFDTPAFDPGGSAYL